MVVGPFRLFYRLWRNNRGNVALITALTAAPLCLLAGGMVDVSLFLSTKTSAQQALDAAALAAAASSATDSATLQATATQVFTANLAGKAGSQATIQTFNYDSVKKQITVTANGTYTPIFSGFPGVGPTPYQVTTTTLKQTDGTLEVALVLDNTWSMSASLDGTNSKLAVLKTAANNLISTIMTTANAGNVKVGIVPYADYVNVGTANRSQPWVSVPADYSTSSGNCTTPNASDQCCTTATTKSVCTTTGTCTSTTDGVVTTSSCCTAYTTQTLNPPVTTCTAAKTTVTNYTWYGCVNDQVQANGSIMMPDPTTPYVGTLATSQKCLTAITPLTTNSTTVTAAINALVDNIGSYKPETYIPGGLTWGINVLSPAAPFTEGAAYDPKNKLPRKVIVLMTDGFNTEYLKSNGTLAVGTTAQEAKTYTDQQALCSYAKSKNIEIYTIGVGVTDPTGLANLQSCATDSAHYFNVQSSAGLISAFTVIAGSLQNLRISQ
jgi:Flp pilus assembly protein TadG